MQYKNHTSEANNMKEVEHSTPQLCCSNSASCVLPWLGQSDRRCCVCMETCGVPCDTGFENALLPAGYQDELQHLSDVEE